MSLAIRWLENEDDTGSGGFLYFDAVQVYTQNYRGQVTKHPIDRGSNIVDHYVKENPVFTVSGVFTSVDVSTGSYLIQDLSDTQPYNTNPIIQDVVVTEDDNMLKRFLPDSIGQFLPENLPEISVQSRRQEFLEQIRDLIIGLNSGEKFNEKTLQFDSNIQIVKLFEFDKTLLKRIVDNLVITNIVFREDVNTGYALYCDLTFEQVKFVGQKRTVIPADVANALKKKTASKVSKGKQDSTPSSDPSDMPSQVDDTDGLRTPFGKVVEQQYGLGGTLNTGSL